MFCYLKENQGYLTFNKLTTLISLATLVSFVSLCSAEVLSGELGNKKFRTIVKVRITHPRVQKGHANPPILNRYFPTAGPAKPSNHDD